MLHIKLLLPILAVALLQDSRFAWGQSPEGKDLLKPYRQPAIERWGEAIEQLEKRDQTETAPEDAILFIGSSSVRLWQTMSTDMAPYPTIRRGYGGARFSDLAVFIDRLIAPHEYAALAIFVANDISGSDQDKTPEEVLELFQFVVSRAREHRPGRPIFFIAITPTSSRWDVWDQSRRANELIEEFCASQEDLHFIETAPYFLGDVGTPNDDLFRDDRLHLNRQGYRLWGEIIKAAIGPVLQAEN